VGSTQKPDVKSSDYGIAIERGARTSGDGGRLVVIGAGDASYYEHAYNAKGASSLAVAAIALKEQFGIAALPQQPILIADPASDSTSLVVASDNGVTLLTGTAGALQPYHLTGQTAVPDAAAYMLAPTRTQPLPLVAVGDNVLGALLPDLGSATQPICKLADSATAGFKAQVRALGVVRTGTAGTTDDVLVWDAGGKLYKYPASVFNGCAPSVEPLGAVDTAFKPDPGARILTLAGTTRVVLQGQSGDTGYLRVFDAAGNDPAPVGPANMVGKLRSAALLVAGSATFVIAGVPTAVVGGTTAGQVVLFKVATTGATGVDPTPAATFNDAQPETNQSFGRSVAAMPFNGTQVIAVAADNEIFVYFRANLSDGTTLYDETRQGR
jgi:hypothetical protein